MLTLTWVWADSELTPAWLQNSSLTLTGVHPKPVGQCHVLHWATIAGTGAVQRFVEYIAEQMDTLLPITAAREYSWPWKFVEKCTSEVQTILCPNVNGNCPYQVGKTSTEKEAWDKGLAKAYIPCQVSDWRSSYIRGRVTYSDQVIGGGLDSGWTCMVWLFTVRWFEYGAEAGLMLSRLIALRVADGSSVRARTRGNRRWTAWSSWRDVCASLSAVRALAGRQIIVVDVEKFTCGTVLFRRDCWYL